MQFFLFLGGKQDEKSIDVIDGVMVNGWMC